MTEQKKQGYKLIHGRKNKGKKAKKKGILNLKQIKIQLNMRQQKIRKNGNKVVKDC